MSNGFMDWVRAAFSSCSSKNETYSSTFSPEKREALIFLGDAPARKQVCRIQFPELYLAGKELKFEHFSQPFRSDYGPFGGDCGVQAKEYQVRCLSSLSQSFADKITECLNNPTEGSNSRRTRSWVSETGFGWGECSGDHAIRVYSGSYNRREAKPFAVIEGYEVKQGLLSRLEAMMPKVLQEIKAIEDRQSIMCPPPPIRTGREGPVGTH